MTLGYRTLSHTLLFLTLCLLVTASHARNVTGLPDFTTLVERNAPAVVNISTQQNSRSSSANLRMPHGFVLPEIPEAGPFGDLLRRFFQEIPEYIDPPQQRHDLRSLGSGFIISPDGYILTNHHVIANADEVRVRLNDRREFLAEVVGSDAHSDTAVLKIPATGLPTVKIGRSADLKVGEWVLAIGSPFGFDHSVTAGIVSAKGRSLPRENYVPFIQTDVAINPGNSGGPLFNLKGEVVGVNAQIYSDTGAYMGLSFAIPIDTAMHVADQIRTKGSVSRGWLGVMIQDVTRELAESFNIDQPRGALVSQVLPDSPARAAGVRSGDIILSFNGREVINSAQLPPIVGITPINEPAKVEILRDGERQTLSIRIAQLPEEPHRTARSRSGAPSEQVSNPLGISVGELSEEQRSERQLAGGVVVEQLRDGAARAAGLREGDIIVKLNNQSIENRRQFAEIVATLESGKSVAVLVEREDGPIFLAVRIP